MKYPQGLISKTILDVMESISESKSEIKKLIKEDDIISLHRRGITLIELTPQDILTPLAKERIKDLSMTIKRV